jgi:HD-GYP domain-containing protein (c-di-GMP phosphodiesterase class II)
MVKTVYYFRPTHLSNVVRKLPRSYRKVPVKRDGGNHISWKLPAVLLADAGEDSLSGIEHLLPADGAWQIIYLMKGLSLVPARVRQSERVFAVLPREAAGLVLEKTMARAFDSLKALEETAKTRKQLHLVASELETLNKIGVALSTERDTGALLDLILTKSREITSSDAGSLYLVEEEKENVKHLLFRLTQSDSHQVPFRQFTLPIDTRSIAGYAAATGRILNIKDAYRIRGLPFRLNRDFDEKFGYRTKSMLVVPMKNQKDEVIGVLQLINAKRNAAVKLTSKKIVQAEVVPYSQRSQELAASLASQAAVALENNLLYRQVENLFENFVKASVLAIESRDPTTFGHSQRVAKLTVGLAQAVDRSDSGPCKDIHFSRQEIQELNYASLLHDFGKVGVREEVLVKADKLYPSQMALVEKRFLYIRKAVELERMRKKMEYLLAHGNQNYEGPFAVIDEEHGKELAKLDEFLDEIKLANKPTVLPEKTSEKLVEIAAWSFEDPSGPTEPLLTPDELKFLSIRKGSLDDFERMQIESHVIHSFKFLSQIPWTKELKNIPNIVRAHHEKLDGSGYPDHIRGDAIPFQTKMMTISDIFDALTARDRPYKKAVPVERALDIIRDDVKSQLLDPVLFHLFLEAKIFQMTAKD